MRRLVAISIGLLICGATIDPPGFAQDPQLDVSRKIVSRVVPVYPELARTMNLQGTVKIRVTVAPNGTVKSTETVGGSPLLVKAAENAVYKWRWIPAKQESSHLVELRFHPE